MKIKVIILSLISFLMMGAAYAQSVEQDDMYFNSKDRAKLRAAQKADEFALASVRKPERTESDEAVLNPTDSYSARNVNPEFTSRSQSQTAQADNEDYFVSNYQYNRTNYNNWNNNYNRWYGNSWYNSNYWAPSIYAWNSPYYGYNNAWSSPWYDPYWSQNSWSSSFSYYYGNSWNYGWGGNYSYWNRPYCGGGGWNSYYGSNYYGSNSFWNIYRYPSVIVMNNNGEAGRNISYGKRPTRGSGIASENNNNSRSRSGVVSSGTRGDISGGRISTNRTQQTEYYNRSWRTNESNSAPTSSDSRSNTQNNRSSSWSNERSTNSSFSTPSRSSNSTIDSGTRSHSSPAPSSSGSGSNGRTRGRD